MLAKNIKVLVVDDMAAMRMRLANQLTQIGFTQIEQAGNGQEALDLIHRKRAEGSPIELVISDWNMPVMSGIDLLEKVRSDADLKTLPFVMVTAEGEKPQVMLALQRGVTDYLIKPVNKDSLAEKLSVIMAVKKAA